MLRNWGREKATTSQPSRHSNHWLLAKESLDEQANGCALERISGSVVARHDTGRGGGDDVRPAALSRPGGRVVSADHCAGHQNHDAELAAIQKLHADVAAGGIFRRLSLAYRAGAGV